MSDEYGYPQWSDEGGGGGGGHQGHHHHQQQRHQQRLPPPPMPPKLPKQASWLLPDHGGGSVHHRLPMPPGYGETRGGGGGMGYGYGGGGGGGYGGNGGNGYGNSARKPQSLARSEVSFDTSAKDPESVRARIFIGSLNSGGFVVIRENVIELCQPYGRLRGVTHFKQQGYAFVQFETAGDADAAIRELNGARWKGCHLDVHLVGEPSSRGPPSSSSGPSGAVAVEQTQKAVPTTTYDEISYDTSSREPALLRARVFIGSLTRGSPVLRNDVIELCAPFGRITAVTLFKQGYAFVQFESPVDAVEACEKLNGRAWKGNKIDVHLAMEGSTRKRNPEDYGESPAESECSGGSAPKRPREEEEMQPQPVIIKPALELICKVCHWSGGDPADFLAHRQSGACSQLTRTGEPPSLACSSCDAVLPNAWRLLFHLQDDQHHKLRLVTADASENGLAKAREADESGKKKWWDAVERWLDGLQKPEEGEVEEETDAMSDVAITDLTIVCGACRLVTEDWAAYKAHRKRDCIKPRDQLEPSCLVCSMCGEGFVSAWKALFHLTDFHRMKLFAPDYTKEAAARAAEQQAREKAAVERRMKTWMERQTGS